jgi:hypothetical protein
MSNRNLIIILSVLLGIFLISKLSNRRGERNFKDVLVELDTTKIDRILLHNVQDDQSLLEIKRQNGHWTAKKEELEVAAQANTVNSLLNTLQLIKSKRLVSKSEAKWVDYEVDSEKGTRVEVYSGNKKLDDFMVGRFNFNQQTRSATSYIRKTDETDTYSVDGFLSMSFNQSFDSFRDKTLIKVNSEDLNQIAMTGSSVNEVLTNDGTGWSNSADIPLDSTKVSQYVNALASSFGSEFDDEFLAVNSEPDQTLEIFGDNMTESIRISCYETEDTLKPFILHSSINEQAFFRSDSSGVYKKIFGDFPTK